MHRIVYTFVLLTIHNTYQQMADMDRLQHDLSKFLSMPRFNETERTVARIAIKTAFDGAGLKSFTHTFKSHDSDELGANVLSIQEGKLYGTHEDRIVVLCANYDTKEDNPGVDDNGSGVAALLETARAMATMDRLYHREYTVIYAIVDRKHESFSGSHEFVEDFLLPLTSRFNATISAVLVLDGLLHFDPFPTSQGTPNGFEEIFPGAAAKLHEHNHMGDFVQLIGRSQSDDLIMQSFIAAFMRSSAKLQNDWSFRPWILPLTINMTDITTMEGLYKLHPYLFADHSSFYFHSKEGLNIPTIYITDTLNYRGVKQYCNYCDGLYMITEPNIRFLTLLTDTVIRTVIHLSASDATAILDELQSSTYLR